VKRNDDTLHVFCVLIFTNYLVISSFHWYPSLVQMEYVDVSFFLQSLFSLAFAAMSIDRRAIFACSTMSLLFCFYTNLIRRCIRYGHV
jgi:hypothetical protein